jgi:carboxyl-terminal processing protease
MAYRRTFAVYLAGFFSGLLMALAIASIAQPAAKPDPFAGILGTAREIMRTLQAEYVDEVNPDSLGLSCIDGMLTKLDSRASWRPPAEPISFPPGTGGIGVEIEMRDSGPTVRSVVADSPAQRAGMTVGDVIAAIEGESTTGKSLPQVVDHIRGKLDTDLRLTIARPSFSDVVARRETLRVQNVRASTPAPGIAYLRVTQFGQVTAGNVALELQRLAKEPAGLQGVILDLRDNQGGLFKSALAIAAFFLPEDATIVTLKGRTAPNNAVYRANPRDYLDPRGQDFRPRVPAEARTVPIAVLLNRGSAAGTELLAGALQDHKRAVIVGERSFGYGMIRTIFPIEGWHAIFATGRWQTPNGRIIDGQGIAPDVAVVDSRAAKQDPVLAQALAALKR